MGIKEEPQLGEISLRQYLSSIIFMPKSMRILCLTNLFCWMSLVCYSLYFTDFVGEAVFGGDPKVCPRVTSLLNAKNDNGKNPPGASWKCGTRDVRRRRPVRLLGDGLLLLVLLLLLLCHRKARQALQVFWPIFF